ncbi:MAG TPA: peptidase S10, partial [Candidatus Dormibacteraeota bacterium]|nr:peptidase S10 [Candidatus Dormibacteraeota bacterium]
MIAGAIVLAFLSPALGIAAPAKPNPGKAPMHVAARFPDAVTHGSVRVHGSTIHYTARAGTITLHDQSDQPTARIFYVAYTKDGARATKRPVTFFYNGGPGSSTMWLHMGSFGPVRVISGSGTLAGPPPYRIVPNGYTLLDKTDEVFIDMPDSGFGRIIGVGKPKMFFGVDQDARAFAQFVQNYLGKFNRWNSPKYLFGESYGTTRDAALASQLQQDGVGLNGVVFQSSILNFGLDWSINFGYTAGAIGGGDWGFVLYLPTEAATAWYHHALPNRPAHLHAFLARVQRFTMGPYLTALAQGAALSQTERLSIANQLHDFTGL